MPLATRRFTVDQYHRMAQAGILTEDDRVELLDGEIVVMTPIGSRHAGTVARIESLFHKAVGDRAIVWVQNPIRPGQFSEPQPDVCLLQPRDDFYTRRQRWNLLARRHRHALEALDFRRKAVFHGLEA